jgi:hypothetical protein
VGYVLMQADSRTEGQSDGGAEGRRDSRTEGHKDGGTVGRWGRGTEGQSDGGTEGRRGRRTGSTGEHYDVSNQFLSTEMISVVEV